MSVSKQDMIDFIAERCSPEKEAEVRAQFKSSESFASKFIVAWAKGAEEALDVDWVSLWAEAVGVGSGAGAGTAHPSNGTASLYEGGRAEHFFAGVLAGAPGSGPSAGSGGAGTKLWRFQGGAEDCIWHSGTPLDAKGDAAIITAEWGNQFLSVAVGGFLRLGKRYALRVEWLSPKGRLRGVGELEDVIAPLRIAGTTRVGPRIGDRLRVRHAWRPARGRGWDLELVAVFGR